MLARAGFDVWVGNNRGTKFSMKPIQTSDYWEYSIDHLVEYDIPCIIDSVLRETRHHQLIYIGHSQGTMQFYTAMDVHPELESKIKCFIGLGPVLSLKHSRDNFWIKLIAKLRIAEILKRLGFKSIFLVPQWMSRLLGILFYNCDIYFKMILFAFQGMCG